MVLVNTSIVVVRINKITGTRKYLQQDYETWGTVPLYFSLDDALNLVKLFENNWLYYYKISRKII